MGNHAFIIGDFLHRLKRPIDLETDKEYKLVIIKMNHNGIVLRGLKKGADIKSNMYELKQGDFILSGIDARNGAFGTDLDWKVKVEDLKDWDLDIKNPNQTEEEKQYSTGELLDLLHQAFAKGYELLAQLRQELI